LLESDSWMFEEDEGKRADSVLTLAARGTV